MAAYVLDGYREVADRQRKLDEQRAKRASFVRKAAGAVRDWFADPFFWDLYEAERSDDLQAMTRLYGKYSAQ